MTITDAAFATVADKVAIRELTATYNRGVDEGRVDDVLACFTTGGAVEIPGTGVLNREAMVRLFEAVAGSVHLTTDAIIEVHGDCARQHCSLLVVGGSSGAERKILTTGRYDDELARTADGWRFARRLVVLDQSIAHLIGEL